jgi:hypothetical protein
MIIDVDDARGERGDNLLIGDPWDLVPHLAEALDVLAKHFPLVLMHRLKIVILAVTDPKYLVLLVVICHTKICKISV